MDLISALSFLPHGPEFRFLDKLTGLDPGKNGSGEYLVRGDESFLRGHFPGQPIFPGVLLVEAAAQLAGVIAQSDANISPLKNLRLTAFRNVKIFGTAQPGETIRLEAEIDGRFANLINARAKAFVGEKMVLQAELTLSGDSQGARMVSPRIHSNPQTRGSDDPLSDVEG